MLNNEPYLLNIYSLKEIIPLYINWLNVIIPILGIFNIAIRILCIYLFFL